MASCTNLIPVESLIFADNVRSPECEAIPAMVESIRRHGFKENHPLVVSQKDTDDGLRYLVLCGNRRGKALHWMIAHDPDAYLSAVVSGKIPALVHKNLTIEQEVLLRIDHSTDEDRVPLDEWSIYSAIKQLLQHGADTQEMIAMKLGLFYTKGKKQGEPNRSYVQPRVNLGRLPQFVEDEMRKYTLDRSTTALRWAHVATLYKLYNAEYVEHPDGDGPQFQAAWIKAITPPEPEAESTDTRKELTPADAVKRSQVASSNCMRQTLLAVTGQSAANLADIDTAMVQGESAVIMLHQIRLFLGDADYRELIDGAKEKAAALESDTIESDTIESDTVESDTIESAVEGELVEA